MLWSCYVIWDLSLFAFCYALHCYVCVGKVLHRILLCLHFPNIFKRKLRPLPSNVQLSSQAGPRKASQGNRGARVCRSRIATPALCSTGDTQTFTNHCPDCPGDHGRNIPSYSKEANQSFEAWNHSVWDHLNRGISFSLDWQKHVQAKKRCSRRLRGNWQKDAKGCTYWKDWSLLRSLEGADYIWLVSICAVDFIFYWTCY